MKNSMSDLAMFGGSAAFLKPLVVGKPSPIDRAALFNRLEWALDNEWLTNGGPLVTEFEHRISRLTGADHCIAVCNATTGLQLVAHGLALSGQVIMPSFTFVATAHSMQWIGLEPVFCDIDPETGCLDMTSVEKLVTEQTSAILGVHLWGNGCAVDELEQLATRKGIRLIFDAAHALGCTVDGRNIGGFGSAEVFSFHATKVVNSFEGGAIVTNDGDLAHRIRALQNFGIGFGEGNVVGGTNGKMSEASAAMGLTSLDSFEELQAHNKRNHRCYASALADTPGISVVEFSDKEQQNYQYVIIKIEEKMSMLSRDVLARLLRHEQVFTKPYFSPSCHRLDPYQERTHANLPNTEQLASTVLALPTGKTVNEYDIKRICNVIDVAVDNGLAISGQYREEKSKVAVNG